LLLPSEAAYCILERRILLDRTPERRILDGHILDGHILHAYLEADAAG